MLPGIKINTGPKDYLPVKQVQLVRFDGERWVRFGEIVGLPEEKRSDANSGMTEAASKSGSLALRGTHWNPPPTKALYQRAGRLAKIES